MSHLAVSPFIGPEQPRTVSGWPQNKTDMKIAFAALLWTQWLVVSGREKGRKGKKGNYSIHYSWPRRQRAIGTA